MIVCRGLEAEAESEGVRHVRQLVRQHQLDGLPAQESDAVELAPVEEELQEARVVRGRLHGHDQIGSHCVAGARGAGGVATRPTPRFQGLPGPFQCGVMIRRPGTPAEGLASASRRAVR